ncbi:hypothetical protein M3O57_01055 [Xanthomonas nasturtii]|uniref:hypothetical protein n=1 Tax=Xanthomonas nasturtii TaxID=1843581 RepID=UPI0011C026AC|nr:hypothetical protein [Xanthomonas nasturtii]MCL1571362.1 hypothetical protein [Xanthomonas nasturtii]MCL1579350.1 hypothetical protein [Xanthomonas nasturtii]MCL1589066.1 hypothetical protein [Xanthomonas nasturtii]WVL53792.1 hypothetical protein M3O59_005075 [Xanthomonas nasturtii]
MQLRGEAIEVRIRWRPTADPDRDSVPGLDDVEAADNAAPPQLGLHIGAAWRANCALVPA